MGSLRAFSFRLTMCRYLAPPLSPSGIKRKRPAPIPAKFTYVVYVGFPCEFLPPDSNAIRRNGRRRRNH